MVYVASDEVLSLPWDTGPGFHVIQLHDLDEPVRRQFSKPWVYYVGSHVGSGCGFQCGENEGFEDHADLAQRPDSWRRLAEFLAVALRRQPEVELFACRDGDQAAEPLHRDRVRFADLSGARPFLGERQLLLVGAKRTIFDRLDWLANRVVDKLGNSLGGFGAVLVVLLMVAGLPFGVLLMLIRSFVDRDFTAEFGHWQAYSLLAGLALVAITAATLAVIGVLAAMGRWP
jgi:hypothetical protein